MPGRMAAEAGAAHRGPRVRTGRTQTRLLHACTLIWIATHSSRSGCPGRRPATGSTDQSLARHSAAQRGTRARHAHTASLSSEPCPPSACRADSGTLADEAQHRAQHSGRCRHVLPATSDAGAAATGGAGALPHHFREPRVPFLGRCVVDGDATPRRGVGKGAGRVWRAHAHVQGC